MSKKENKSKIKKETEDYKIDVWNQLAGLNPTGQMYFKNGTLKSTGNPSKIVTPAQLQSMNLKKTSVNNPIDVKQKTTVTEGFGNMNMNIKDKFNYEMIVYGLMAIVLVLIFWFNQKKI